MTYTIEDSVNEIKALNEAGDLLVVARLDSRDSSGPGGGFGASWLVQPGLMLRQQLDLSSFYVRARDAEAWVKFIADAWERKAVDR